MKKHSLRIEKLLVESFQTITDPTEPTRPAPEPDGCICFAPPCICSAGPDCTSTA